MKCRTIVPVALGLALVASCKGSPEGSDDYLGVVDTSEIVTQDDASLRAQREITEANLEEQFEQLKDELEADR